MKRKRTWDDDPFDDCFRKGQIPFGRQVLKNICRRHRLKRLKKVAITAKLDWDRLKAFRGDADLTVEELHSLTKALLSGMATFNPEKNILEAINK